MSRDELYMQRCLQIAALGFGKVQPNPMVGAVIVHNDIIIGEGYHQQYGEAHAEVNAIASVQEKALLRESTLYVNLEPCSHFGKTPPCADLIIKHQIPRVVVGTTDTNSKVNGEGIARLRQAGIEVSIGTLSDACLQLNRRFFTFHEKQRPYIILKWAQTANGYIDLDRSEGNRPYWITNEVMRFITHKWRSEEQAILIGYNTLRNDAPLLTTRAYPGKSPKRYVVVDDSRPYTLPEGFTALPHSLDQMMEQLHHDRIQSVMVEGGKKTIEQFLAADLWDEARVLTGSIRWEKGSLAPTLSGNADKCYNINDNILNYYYHV